MLNYLLENRGFLRNTIPPARVPSVPARDAGVLRCLGRTTLLKWLTTYLNQKMNRTTPEPLSRMHRVLSIPELLDMIFSFLPLPSNAVNARVCKRWSEIALDLLWRDVDDINRLFGTLAPLRKSARNEYVSEYFYLFIDWSQISAIQEFDRLPEAGDWRRFEKYGSRIRRLVYKSGSTPMKQSVFDEIARTRTRLDILPNMHTLHWKAPLSLSLIFMHSGVKHFIVHLPIDLNTVSPRPFFQDVTARMPKLITLDIRSSVPMNAIQEEMIVLISSLPKLHKIVFPRFYVTTKVAEALSRLEHLSVIEFQYASEQGCGAPGDVEPFQPVLTEGAFPALWDHSITASFDDVARFVDIPFAPTNLTSLYVDSDDIETPKSVYDILSILSENCQMLKFLALVSLRDAGTAFLESPFDETMIITMETLQPVLKLVNLTSLELVHQYPFALKQHDIELLAATWPGLETLLLNTEPVYSEKSNLTLEALTPFAKYCPKLTHLGIFLDATTVETPLALSATYPTPVFQRLRRLSMGVSIIKDDHTVALYLSQLLPLQCTLDCGITWDDSTEIDPEIDTVVQDRCDVWAKVAEFLPLLTRLRLEERAKSKAMLAELEDLRMRTTVMKETAAMGIRLDLSTCVMI